MATTSWFDAGVEAASFLGEGAYYCPLCMKPFKRSQIVLLTREDVPPASLGGHPLVLTCAACNNTAGSSIESDMKLADDLDAFGRGRLGVQIGVRLPVGDSYLRGRATVQLGKEGRVIWDAIFPEALNNPETFRSMGQEHQPGQIIEFLADRSPRRRRSTVGWLKASYLVAFAALGYHYIAQEPLEAIRAPIRQPGRRICEIYHELISEPKAPECLGCLSSPTTSAVLWFKSAGTSSTFHRLLVRMGSSETSAWQRLRRHRIGPFAVLSCLGLQVPSSDSIETN